jgi:endoglucanase
MALDFDLLSEIAETPGAPGHEHRIRKLVLEKAAPFIDGHEIDNLGNLICHKKGNGQKKILLAAHMDEISFMVSHIEDDGFVRFHPMGGFDPKTLVSERVWAHGQDEDLLGVIAIKPIHISTQEDKNKALNLEDLVIDFGMPGNELREKLSIGDPITRQQDPREMGHCVTGKSLDNRISVYALLDALRRFEGCEYDVYAAFSVQEEVGLRGAMVLGNTIDPDYALAIDTTIAYDMPMAQAHERMTSLGQGVGIKMMDSGTIADKRMVNYLKQTAEHNAIPWQAEVMKRGGTDTAYLQRAGRHGAIAGAVSIPTRHIHTTVETVHKEDLEHSVQLLTKSLANLHSYDFGWPR